jgi:uncharacterized membrane protein YfcA
MQSPRRSVASRRLTAELVGTAFLVVAAMVGSGIAGVFTEMFVGINPQWLLAFAPAQLVGAALGAGLLRYLFRKYLLQPVIHGRRRLWRLSLFRPGCCAAR